MAVAENIWEKKEKEKRNISSFLWKCVKRFDSLYQMSKETRDKEGGEEHSSVFQFDKWIS